MAWADSSIVRWLPISRPAGIPSPITYITPIQTRNQPISISTPSAISLLSALWADAWRQEGALGWRVSWMPASAPTVRRRKHNQQEGQEWLPSARPVHGKEVAGLRTGPSARAAAVAARRSDYPAPGGQHAARHITTWSLCCTAAPGLAGAADRPRGRGAAAAPKSIMTIPRRRTGRPVGQAV
jgi:hypothetical protein